MSKEISNENREAELAIQNEINSHLEQFKSFCFDAGAGAGKTYALKESIEYILENKTDDLVKQNQKILCITYTNTAKDEISDRIGINSCVTVSTIHNFLWDFIGRQQPLLAKEHKKLIKFELAELQNKLNEFAFYTQLNDSTHFEEIVLDPQFLDIFNKYYSKSAAEFRNNIKDCIQTDTFDTNEVLKNVDNFKKVVTLLNKRRKLREALLIISKKQNEKIRYFPSRNRDNLSKFIISHDTLLSYASSIIKDNDLIKRIFFNKYPYVLVDEYQDTDKKVIDIFNSVLDYSKKGNVNFLIGYFGDYMQNIYSDGVGKLTTDSTDFKSIKKVFNRRSATPIIEVIEKIRNDNFGQKSIYQNFTDGSYRFYHCKSDQLEFQLPDSITNSNSKNKFTCLLLKNESIAQKRNFGNLLNAIKSFPKFKGNNYNNINSEFLSSNLQNMGWFFKQLYNFIDFIDKIKNNNSTVKEITAFIDSHSKITYKVLCQLVKKVRSIDSITLGQFIEDFGKIDIQLTEESSNQNEFESILQNIFSIENLKNHMQEIKNQAYDYFYINYKDSDIDTDDSERETDDLDAFFKLNMDEYIAWYHYIKENDKENDVVYYTLHKSKGLEFDNVVIVLENKFGRKKDYIKFFFENYCNPTLTLEESVRFNTVRNLLYVACSRAKKNLRIVYCTESISSTEKDNIEKIFGNIETLGNFFTDELFN